MRTLILIATNGKHADKILRRDGKLDLLVDPNATDMIDAYLVNQR